MAAVVREAPFSGATFPLKALSAVQMVDSKELTPTRPLSVKSTPLRLFATRVTLEEPVHFLFLKREKDRKNESKPVVGPLAEEAELRAKIEYVHVMVRVRALIRQDVSIRICDLAEPPGNFERMEVFEIQTCD